MLRTAAIGALMVLALAICGGASAQSFTGPAPGEAREVSAPGPIERLTTAVRVYQQRFYRELGEAVQALKDGYSGEAALGLIAIALIYGVFHAAGPGHGKAVISAYMLANERSVRRGIVLAGLASLAQAATAIVAVYGFILLVGATGRRVNALAGDLEIVSHAMITGIGLWLLARAAGPLLRPGMAHAHAHGGGGHAHHDHGEETCGHAHIPSPALADRPLSVRTALPIVASIGLRPCSGAIVVLIFAHTLGLYGAGIAAALAMALGTAATVAALASLAVGSREFAAWAIGRSSRHAATFYRAVAIAGALAVTALGIVLLHAALTVPPRPFT